MIEQTVSRVFVRSHISSQRIGKYANNQQNKQLEKSNLTHGKTEKSSEVEEKKLLCLCRKEYDHLKIRSVFWIF